MRSQVDVDAPSLAALLPESTMAALRRAATAVAYPDESLIYSRGEMRPGLSVVRSGAVQFSNPGVDGSSVVTSVLGPGHCFGEMTLFGKLPRTHDSIAVGHTVIDQLTPGVYRALSAAHPEINEAILGMMARRIHALLEFSDDLRRLPVIVQLAKTLQRMAVWDNREVDPRGAIVAINHDELGATLGVSRVAIGSALGRLERAGLIVRGYRRITIVDRARINQWVADRAMLSPIIPLA